MKESSVKTVGWIRASTDIELIYQIIILSPRTETGPCTLICS